MSIPSKTDAGTKEQSRPQSKFHALNTPLGLTWPKHRGNQKCFTRICQRKSVGSCRNSKQSQLPHRLTLSNLSLGRLFWESTDTEIVSDLMSTRAEIESGTRNWDCLCPPREDLRFSTPKGSIRGSGDPYISNLGHRESSPSSQGKYKLSPSCVQLGICSPSQSDIDNMVQAWKLGSILSI